MNQQRHTVTRREFVQTTGAVVGGAAAAGIVPAAAGAGPNGRTLPKAVLGRTGVEVPRLGIGCQCLARERVQAEDVHNTLHRAIELGVSYFDVAPNYGNERAGWAEVKMGPFLPEIRDKMFLVTKTEEHTYEGTWRLLRQSMKRLRTDHLDLVHLHNFGFEKRWPDIEFVMGDKGAMGALREARKQGVVRFIGASGHTYPSRFHEILGTGEIDVLMNAVNFVSQHVYDFEHKVWPRARRQNVGLVAMKVLGGCEGKSRGMLIPEAHYEQAIRYALSIPGATAAVIGLETVAEVEQAAATVARFQPLTEQESSKLSRLGLELAATKDWKLPYGGKTA